MKTRLTRPALIDLADIEAWIAQDNPAAARRLSDRIMSACRGLGRFPLRHPVTVQGLRKRSVGAYLIFYRVTEEVEILRVLHGARDAEALLGEDR
ncbi:type II toxin-antitoxin system RelE/ParE family toxin [Brevundimonas sp.]|jgi:plasmid stabilization system protein ParE|uniref:type II toxin-antitoxin system RelE/ParE family toxin n=1 Tax=Brevundimonas sp. TaxID=1871086 RepID=UPI002E131F22|nr:type II toxin-antitoxin system RelE/ParE family toxin [Brevundimonas sp.]